MEKQTIGAEKALSKKPGNKRIICLIGLLLAVIILAMVFFLPYIFAGGEVLGEAGVIGWKEPLPLVYEKDGVVFMANGDETTALGSVHEVILSEDNGYFLYLADYDKTTGAGNLMMAQIGGDTLPKTVAKDVCEVSFSCDDERVLYFKDMDGMVGDLYSCHIGQQVEWVAHSVMPKDYGFSPNGKNIYYITQTGQGDELCQTIYVKKGDEPPEKVDEVVTGSGWRFSFGSIVGEIPLDNDGRLIYTRNSSLASDKYLYVDGKTDRIFSYGIIVKTYGRVDEFVCYGNGNIYYKASDERKERLTKQAVILPWFAEFSYHDLCNTPKRRFLFMEADMGLDEPYPEKAMLFEQELGKDKVEIAEADTHSYHMNPDFSRVAFQKDDITYLTHKQGEVWSEPIVVCDAPMLDPLGKDDITFDVAGQYLYYITCEGEYPKDGELYRYALESGESEFLLSDVTHLNLIEDVPYAITTNDEVYRADVDGRLLEENVSAIYRTDGGVYLVTGEDVQDIYTITKTRTK